jgi:Restriction endonuclease
MANETTRGPAAAKRIHPEAYTALAEAVLAILWFKSDLKAFLTRRTAGYPGLAAGLDFTDLKRNTVNEFVDRLVTGGSRYYDLSLGIMLEVAAMTSFPGLKSLEDREARISEARARVAELKTWVDRHRDVLDEREAVEAELAAYLADGATRRSTAAQLDKLRVRFLDLSAMTDRQEAGRRLEKLLDELFRLFDLEPRLSYNLVGEQIDGAMSFDTDDYIIEAKWWRDPVDTMHLRFFRSKVDDKGKNALGLFISISGFTADALAKNKTSAPFITMDGADLYAVLEDRIALAELLRRKKRAVNETGNCYYPVAVALVD